MGSVGSESCTKGLSFCLRAFVVISLPSEVHRKGALVSEQSGAKAIKSN